MDVGGCSSQYYPVFSTVWGELVDNLVDKKTTRGCRFLFANRIGFWEIRSWKFCGTSSQRAATDAEAVTGAAATSASPSRGCRRDRLSRVRRRTRQVLRRSRGNKGVAVTEAGRGDPTAEVRPPRAIGVARRWKAPRVRRSVRAFASSSRQRPSGKSDLAFGWGAASWATSSLGTARRKSMPEGSGRAISREAAVHRTGGESSLFRARSATGKRREVSEPAPGWGKSVRALSGVRAGVVRSIRSFATPELGRFGWCPPQGGASSVTLRVRSQRQRRSLRALGRVLGSIQLQKLMGTTWPWEAPVNSRLGPQV